MAGTTAIGCLLKGHFPDPQAAHPLVICQEQCHTASPKTSNEVSPIIDGIIKDLVMPPKAYDLLAAFHRLKYEGKPAEAALAIDEAVMMIDRPDWIINDVTAWYNAVGMDAEAVITTVAPWLAKYWEVLWRGHPPAQSPATPREIFCFLYQTVDHLEMIMARDGGAEDPHGSDTLGPRLNLEELIVDIDPLTGKGDAGQMYRTRMGIEAGPASEAIIMMDAIFGQLWRWPHNLRAKHTLAGVVSEQWIAACVWPRDNPAMVLACLRWNDWMGPGHSLKHMGPEVRDDRLIVEEAGPYELEHASERLRNDPNVVLSACVCLSAPCAGTLHGVHWNLSALRAFGALEQGWPNAGIRGDKLPKPVQHLAKGDTQILNQVCGESGLMNSHDAFARVVVAADRHLFRYASDAVRRDREVVLNLAFRGAGVVATPGEYAAPYELYMDCLPSGFYDDPSFLLELIDRDFGYFATFPSHLKEHCGFVQECVERNPQVIGHVLAEGLLSARVFEAYYGIFSKWHTAHKLVCDPWTAAREVMHGECYHTCITKPGANFTPVNDGRRSIYTEKANDRAIRTLRPLYKSAAAAVRLLALAGDHTDALQLAQVFTSKIRRSATVKRFLDQIETDEVIDCGSVAVD